MATRKQIAANKKNAKLSTGAKTPKGKSIVKWNALKHGLLSKEITIDFGDGKECRADFINLLSALTESLYPVGTLEEMLVEKIAVCYWRLRRCTRAEVGEIRKDLDSATHGFILRKIKEMEFEKEFSQLSDSRQRLKGNSFGLMFLIKILDEAIAEVKDIGYLSQEGSKQFAKVFGTEERSLGGNICLLSYMAAQTLKEKGEDSGIDGHNLNDGKSKNAILTMLKERKKDFEESIQTIRDIEDMEFNAQFHSNHIPSAEIMDKIIRYETAIERQLYRALHELIRLQGARLGQKPPAPIAVDVNIGDAD